MLNLLQFRGEAAALLSALIWAVAALVYTEVGQQCSPVVLNFTKGWLALGMLLLTLLVQGGHPVLPIEAVGMLLASGALAIGLADTAYFEALNCIGPRRTLLIATLAPGIVAVLSWWFLGESLSVQAGFGIVLTLAGIVWVIREQNPVVPMEAVRMGRGVWMAVLSAITQALGTVLSRAAFLDTAIDPLWSTGLRLMGGTITLLIWIVLQGQQGQVKALSLSRRLMLTVAVTAFFGTYLGIWLQQTALKYTQAGIAQALNSTSPLFILPIGVVLGERLSFRACLGAGIACVGVALLLLT